MPGVYAPGAFDIAGTLIGIAERGDLLPRDVAAGDVLVGVASSGPHTNGYSLLRKIFEWVPMDVVPDGMDRPLGEALLEPHRSYLGVLKAVLASGAVKALAHITGGDLYPENIPPRAAERCQRRDPPRFVARPAAVPSSSAAHDGHGMHASCTAPSTWASGWSSSAAPDRVADVQSLIAEPTWVIGELVPGTREVRLLGG